MEKAHASDLIFPTNVHFFGQTSQNSDFCPESTWLYVFVPECPDVQSFVVDGVRYVNTAYAG